MSCYDHSINFTTPREILIVISWIFVRFMGFSERFSMIFSILIILGLISGSGKSKDTFFRELWHWTKLGKEAWWFYNMQAEFRLELIDTSRKMEYSAKSCFVALVPWWPFPPPSPHIRGLPKSYSDIDVMDTYFLPRSLLPSPLRDIKTVYFLDKLPRCTNHCENRRLIYLPVYIYMILCPYSKRRM